MMADKAVQHPRRQGHCELNIQSVYFGFEKSLPSHSQWIQCYREQVPNTWGHGKEISTYHMVHTSQASKDLNLQCLLSRCLLTASHPGNSEWEWWPMKILLVKFKVQYFIRFTVFGVLPIRRNQVLELLPANLEKNFQNFKVFLKTWFFFSKLYPYSFHSTGPMIIILL